MILENERYRVTIDAKEIVDFRNFTIEGGRLQAIRNKLNDDDEAIYHVRDSLVELYQRARAVMDVIEMSIIRKKLDTLSGQYNARVLDYVRANHDNLVGVALIYEGLMHLPYKQLKARYELLSEIMQNTPEGKVASRRLNWLGSMQSGGQFLEFRLPSVSGDTIALSELKGKVKLIDFWASWCKPCRMKIKELKKEYDRLQELGIEVIAISCDKKKEDWLKAVEEDQPMWEQLRVDQEINGSDTADDYKVEFLPTLYLISPDGMVLETNPGIEEIEYVVKNNK